LEWTGASIQRILPREAGMGRKGGGVLGLKLHRLRGSMGGRRRQKHRIFSGVPSDLKRVDSKPITVAGARQISNARKGPYAMLEGGLKNT